QQPRGPPLPVRGEGGGGVADVHSQGGEHVAQSVHGDRGPHAPPVGVARRDAVFFGQSDQFSIAHTIRSCLREALISGTTASQSRSRTVFSSLSVHRPAFYKKTGGIILRIWSCVSGAQVLPPSVVRPPPAGTVRLVAGRPDEHRRS